MRGHSRRKRELLLLLTLWMATSAQGQEQPASAAAAPPTTSASAPVEAGPAGGSPPVVVAPKVDLIVEEAKKGLARKADGVRTYRDLGENAKAVVQATEFARDWQRLANQWRGQAEAEIQKVVAGKATTSDADRLLKRYALGEAEAQKAHALLGDTLAAAGRHDEHDRLMLERLRTLEKKAIHPALADALRSLVSESENRLLTMASGRADRGENQAVFGLLTRLYAETSTESRRRSVVERLLAFYSDLITNKQFGLAGKVALWYARRGDERAHTWKEETLRLARLALGSEPSCAGGGESGKESEGGTLELAHLLCRFFVDPGLADSTVWILLGRAHQQAGEFELAVRWYTSAAEELDHDGPLHLRMAECFAALGRLEESVWAAVMAVRLGVPVRRVLDDPELAAIRSTKGYVWLANESIF